MTTHRNRDVSPSDLLGATALTAVVCSALWPPLLFVGIALFLAAIVSYFLDA